MEERTVQLKGATAELRTLHPQIVLETINLTFDEMTDTVALIDERITDVYVEKNSYRLWQVWTKLKHGKLNYLFNFRGNM